MIKALSGASLCGQISRVFRRLSEESSYLIGLISSGLWFVVDRVLEMISTHRILEYHIIYLA